MSESEITLRPMTRTLCHRLYRGWENDESIYMDMSLFKPYEYSAERVDRYFDKKQEPTRVLLAVMRGEEPIGELQLKEINREAGSCVLSIHLQNDAVKGLGYGTEAERQAIGYAFHTLGLHTVLADTVLKNKRSQHVLEKVGFHFERQEGEFRYYRMERE